MGMGVGVSHGYVLFSFIDMFYLVSLSMAASEITYALE